jgi:autotransporter-associated beta strand protein
MKPIFVSLTIAVAIVLVAVTSTQAAVVTYDANTTTAGAQDGAGANWNATNGNFWDGSADVLWPNTTADEAIFGAGSGTAGTVTVEAVNANKITFNAPGSGNYTLSGGTITLGGTTPTIAANTNATINSVLAGTSGLIKTGTGTLALGGGNTFSGNVAINAGTVVLGHKDAFGADSPAVTKVVVASGATVDFNGKVDAYYGYTIAGTGANGTGALINTGGNIGNGNLQSSNITLSADAMIGGTGNFALLAPGYGATKLDLAGFTLTKAGSNTFTVCNTTFTPGTVRIATGTFAQYNRVHDASMVAFTLDDAANAKLALSGFNLSVGSLAGGGTTGGTVDLGANTLTVGGLGTSTAYSGAISGTGGLTKVGAGALTLGGNSTFTGNVAVAGGVLKLGSSSALGSSNTAASKVVIASGAAVELNGIPNAAYGYTIAGAGVGDTGALVNTGANIGNGSAQSSNIKLAADATIGGTGDFALVAPNHDPNMLDLAGFTLTKAGANTFTVANTTFTGGTIRIAGGTFTQYRRAHDASAVAFALNDTLGARLALGGYDLSVGSLAGGGATGGAIDLGDNRLTVGGLGTSTSYAGVISGNGGLTKIGAGTLTLSGNSTFTGSVLVNEGVVKIGYMNAFGTRSVAVTKVIIAPGATVDLNGKIDPGYGYTIAGTGFYGTGAIINTGGHIGNGTLQTSNIKLAADAMIGGTGNFALLASGYGATKLDLAGFTLTKAGSNTFTVCNTTFTPGTIRIAGGTFTQHNGAHDASMVAFTLDDTANAKLALSGFDLKVGSLAGGGTTGGGVDLGAKMLTVGGLGTSTAYAGVISGTGSLTKTGSGTLTLAGTSTYSGGTTVNAGTLLVNNTTGSGTGSGMVTVNGGTLGGTGTIGGGATLAGGTLAPGNSIGAITLGSLLENAGSTIEIEIASPTSFDLVNVTGAATLNGQLAVRLLDGYAPTSGTTFDVLTAGSPIDASGLFLSSAGSMAPAQFWRYSLVNGDRTLRLEVGVPEPSTLALLGIGVAGLLVCLGRRRV